MSRNEKKNSSNIKRIVGSNHSMSKEGSVAFICKVLDSVNNSGMHVSRLMFKSSNNNYKDLFISN